VTSLLGKALATRAMPANTLDARDAMFAYTGNTYPTGAVMSVPSAGDREGGSSSNYEQAFRNTMLADGPVAACMLARRSLLSEARFVWQRIQRGRPTTIFGSPELSLLEQPWPNGTTGQLIARMSDLEGLAGNAFVVRRGEARTGDERLVLPRPDWTVIVGGNRNAPEASADVWDLDTEIIGYIYFPGGPLSGRDPVPLLVEDVAHYAPNPDPLSRWRGMSWLTPVLREVEADQAATDHKAAFFRNGASPQIVVSFDAAIKQEQVQKMAAQLNALTTGTGNAYRTLYLGGGADVTVVGRDLAQLDFANTQGRDETRIAAASGIHPVVLGLSEGLSGSSLNAGNFQAARRLTADRTLRPLWRGVCEALGSITTSPTPDNPTRGGGTTPVRLWIDERDIPFLREDIADVAAAQLTRAQAIAALVREGFDPDSVVAWSDADDLTLLTHTGAVSVQLQKTGPDGSTQTSTPTPPPQDGQPTGANGRPLAGAAAANGNGAGVGSGGVGRSSLPGLDDLTDDPDDDVIARYKATQPRASDGKWSHGGGGGAGAASEGGVPAGWGSQQPEGLDRGLARRSYDTLKGAGVWEGAAPPFETWYSRQNEILGKFNKGPVLTKKIGGSNVRIETADLPREHWKQAAADVEAVVGRNPAHPEVTYAYHSGGFEGEPNTLGMTRLGDPHVEINPTLYTKPPASYGAAWMPSATGHVSEYVTAHEYGHTLGAGKGHGEEIAQIWDKVPGVSGYGRGLQAEAAAEAYAEWHMTKGKTTNQFARAVAKIEGWK
jgi:hypothetical protein